MGMATLTHFLLISLLINVGLVWFMAVACLLFADSLYAIHARWFPMPREDWNRSMFMVIAACIILVIMFNLLPYLALLVVG